MEVSDVVSHENEEARSVSNNEDASNNLNIVICDTFTLENLNFVEEQSTIDKRKSNDKPVNDEKNIKRQTRDTTFFSSLELACNKLSNQHELTGNKLVRRRGRRKKSGIVICQGETYNVLLNEGLNLKYADVIKPCSVVIENNLASCVKATNSERSSQMKKRNSLRKIKLTEKGKTLKKKTCTPEKPGTSRISKLKFSRTALSNIRCKRIITNSVKKLVKDFTPPGKNSVQIITKSELSNKIGRKNSVENDLTKKADGLMVDRLNKSNHQLETFSLKAAENSTSMLITDNQSNQQVDVSIPQKIIKELPLSPKGDVTNNQFFNTACGKIQLENQDLVEKLNEIQVSPKPILSSKKVNLTHNAKRIPKNMKANETCSIEGSPPLNSSDLLKLQITSVSMKDKTHQEQTIRTKELVGGVQLGQMKPQGLPLEKSAWKTSIEQETIVKMRQKITHILGKERRPKKYNEIPILGTLITKKNILTNKTKKRKIKKVGRPSKTQTVDIGSAVKGNSLQPDSDLNPDCLLSDNKHSQHSWNPSDYVPLAVFNKNQHQTKQLNIESNPSVKNILTKINKLKQISLKTLPTSQESLRNTSSCSEGQTKKSKHSSKCTLEPAIVKTNILEKRLSGSVTLTPISVNNPTFLSNSPFCNRPGCPGDDCFPINCKNKESEILPMSPELVDCLDGVPPFIREVFKCENIRDGFINADLVFVLSLLPDMEEMTDAQKIHFQLKVIDMLHDVINDPQLQEKESSLTK